MSLLKQVSGYCFAQKCEVRLFDIDDELDMRKQLDHQAECLPLGGYGPGQGYNPPRRYFYDVVTNRCFCPGHGRELLRLRTSLPIAVQELAALSLIRSDVPDLQIQEAISRVRHLRLAESMLLRENRVPTSREAEDGYFTKKVW